MKRRVASDITKPKPLKKLRKASFMSIRSHLGVFFIPTRDGIESGKVGIRDGIEFRYSIYKNIYKRFQDFDLINKVVGAAIGEPVAFDSLAKVLLKTTDFAAFLISTCNVT
uniref:Uncharacterized protein n=1 Tax=Acrobeloides nanus TaxID=290746 RepID=A0A914CAH2_9BILA